MTPSPTAKRPRPAAGLAAGAACLLAAVIAAAGPARATTTPGPGARVTVSQGTSPAALAGARALGATAADTIEHVSFVLKARSLSRLEFDVETGMTSGDLSVSQFASDYGQPAANVSALRNFLAQYGIAAQAYPDRLDVSATGTAAQFAAALGTDQHDYYVPAVAGRNGQRGIAAQRIHASVRPATLPRPIARFVECIFGLNSYSPYTSNLVDEPVMAAGARVAGPVNDSQTPLDFARRYGLGPLYAQGYDGAGQTIGIVALASVNPRVPSYFWRDILHLKVPAGRITLTNVDGGAGRVSLANGSDETTLDVEQSGGVAPGAHIDVYQAPATPAGFADAFYDAASQNVADTVSTSFGASETIIAGRIAARVWPATYVQAFDQALLELAAQGQSTFAAAGDSGAYAASGDAGTTNLSVQNPGSSPFVTSAGGTTLAGTLKIAEPNGHTATIRIPAQRDWAWDYGYRLWKAFGAASEAQFAETTALGGSGGGFSAAEPTPLYQQSVSGTHRFRAVEYLTPDKYKVFYGLTLPTAWTFNPAPSVSVGTGTGRAVPDLATDADPFTGYEIYDPQYKDGALQGRKGGTSFAAPQLNGSAAVIDSYTGGRTGFWNPAIYRFAVQPGSPFTPLGTSGTSNDNVYYTGTPGQTYNLGTGLGLPDLSRLAEDFAVQAAQSRR